MLKKIKNATWHSMSVWLCKLACKEYIKIGITFMYKEILMTEWLISCLKTIKKKIQTKQTKLFYYDDREWRSNQKMAKCLLTDLNKT